MGGKDGKGRGALLWESPSISGQPLNLLSFDSFSVPGQYTPHRGCGGLRCLKGVSELGPEQGCFCWSGCWEQSPNVSSRQVQSQGSPPGPWGPGSRNCRCFSSPYDVGQCGAVCVCKHQRRGWEVAPEACWDSEGSWALVLHPRSPMIRNSGGWCPRLWRWIPSPDQDFLLLQKAFSFSKPSQDCQT